MPLKSQVTTAERHRRRPVVLLVLLAYKTKTRLKTTACQEASHYVIYRSLQDLITVVFLCEILIVLTVLLYRVNCHGLHRLLMTSVALRLLPPENNNKIISVQNRDRQEVPIRMPTTKSCGSINILQLALLILL